MLSSATDGARQVGELVLDAMRDADHALGRRNVSSGDAAPAALRCRSEYLGGFLDGQAEGDGGGGQAEAFDQRDNTPGAHSLADGGGSSA